MSVSASETRGFLERYARFFSIHEIVSDRILQLSFGALLFSFFFAFSIWSSNDAISLTSYISNTHTCWPYFPECGRLYFLEPLPYGYSQMLFYMGIYVVMLAICYLIYLKDWVRAHLLMAILWLWKVLVLFVLTQEFSANYDYYDVILTFVLLFLPYKLFFLRLTFVWLYFLAGTIKIHEGWVLGTYFTTLQTGLPIFGNAFAPLITGVVIFMQIVGSWLLLSKRELLQKAAFAYFFLFHVYSGILVGYRYPTVALILVVILFGLYRTAPTFIPFTKRTIPAWIFLALLLCIQLYPIVAIRGDQKITLEGNKYGLYMFEANHQCVSRITTHYVSGAETNEERTSANSRSRCDPYAYWFGLHSACEHDPLVERIEWTFDHSVNGEPFYRIVDTENACALEYRPFTHNAWIRLPEEGALIVAYPQTNYYN